MRKIFFRKLLILGTIFVVCLLTGILFIFWFFLWRFPTAPPDLRFVSKTNSLLSPSGAFTAEQENLSSHNGTYFIIHILDSSGKRIHTCESLYRHQDNNFVLWADNEDILWAYNGDIGTSCWVLENGSWVEYSYLGGTDHAEDGTYIGNNDYYDDVPHGKVDVPQALTEVRSKTFPVKTITVYAKPDERYREHFYKVYPVPTKPILDLLLSNA